VDFVSAGLVILTLLVTLSFIGLIVFFVTGIRNEYHSLHGKPRQK
jgi:hypothetical protein